MSDHSIEYQINQGVKNFMSIVRSVVSGVALFLLALGFNQPAKAALFHYELNGAINESFTIDTSSPTTRVSAWEFYFTNVDGLGDGKLYFADSAVGGGFQFFATGQVNAVFNIFGVQLFSGNTNSPTLLTFDNVKLANYFDPEGPPFDVFLTVTAAAVPGPIVGAGLPGVVMALG